eukprot:10100258-Alexandrium_andersonii.AAC.1
MAGHADFYCPRSCHRRYGTGRPCLKHPQRQAGCDWAGRPALTSLVSHSGPPLTSIIGSARGGTVPE